MLRGYSTMSIALLNDIEDTDRFFKKYNPDNNWGDLKIGEEILIKTTVYDDTWVIAGFDNEYNCTAEDGTIYNNGRGICLIPRLYLYLDTWNNENDNIQKTGYINSKIHDRLNSDVYYKLYSTLGDHLVLRNMLLTSKTDENGKATEFIWTTAYLALLSAAQIIFPLKGSDDGEATRPLELFYYENHHFPTNTDYNITNFYIRSLHGARCNTMDRVWAVDGESGAFLKVPANQYCAIVPTIYLR